MPDPLHVELVNQWIEATTIPGNIDLLDEIIAEDYKQLGGDIPDGREPIKAMFAETGKIFADPRVEVKQIVSDGDTFVVHWVLYGTHVGDFFGIAPTGKEIAMESKETFTVRDGMLASHHGIVDTIGYLYQMGVLEPGWPFSSGYAPQ